MWGAGAGADALRSSVTAGNVVLLRTKSNNTKSVLSGGVDPTTFPRIPGYAYLLDDTGTRRSAPMRGYYLDDQTRDQAAREVSWPELDPASAAAAGPVYQRRRELLDAARQALADRIAALTGQTPKLPAQARSSTVPAAPVIPLPRFPRVPTIHRSQRNPPRPVLRCWTGPPHHQRQPRPQWRPWLNSLPPASPAPARSNSDPATAKPGYARPYDSWPPRAEPAGSGTECGSQSAR